MQKLRIAFTGGGSGGHVYPLLAVAGEVQKLATGSDLQMDYFGPKDAFAVLITSSGMRFHSVMGAKLRNYSILQNILDVPKFFIGILQAFWKVFWVMPDVIFSKGGTGAFPVVLAGWFYRVPVIIHESDAIPGATNILSARFATRIALAYEGAKNYFDSEKTAVVGNPVRPWLLIHTPDVKEAKNNLGFKPELPLTLILGGSQGSTRINEFVISHLNAIIKETQILHQTGAGNFTEMQTLAKAALGDLESFKSPYKITPYFKEDEELKIALTAADCIVSRAGSGAITEAAAFGKPMILIPLPESAHDHQRANAKTFETAGGAVIIEEENLLSGIFIGALKQLLTNEEKRKKMSAASLSFVKVDAAQTIAKEILLLGEH